YYSRTARAANEQSTEQIRFAAFSPAHSAESSCAKPLTDVRYSGLHGIPETLRHNAPLWNGDPRPLLFWAGLAHLAPRLGVSGLLRPVPDLPSAIALVSEYFPYRGRTPRLHCARARWLRRWYLFGIQ